MFRKYLSFVPFHYFFLAICAQFSINIQKGKIKTNLGEIVWEFVYVNQLYSLWEERECSSFAASMISHYSCLPFYSVCFIYHAFCMLPYLLLD